MTKEVRHVHDIIAALCHVAELAFSDQAKAGAKKNAYVRAQAAVLLKDCEIPLDQRDATFRTIIDSVCSVRYGKRKLAN